MVRKKICIAGVTGLVGANLAKKALARGYTINGTTRDTSDLSKIKYLNRFSNSDNLKFFEANMSESETFNDSLSGVDALFICCLIPIYKSPNGVPASRLSQEEGKEYIMAPTIEGCINILEAANRYGVKNIIICSSTASANPIGQVQLKNEVDHWSDEIVQVKAKKFTSAAKTIMEKRAFKFCQEKQQRLCIFLPTGLYGELLVPAHLKHNPYVWLNQLLEGGEPRHEICPDDSISMIHTEDLAELFLAALENNECQGRYFGVYRSLHWEDIYKECEKYIPNMKRPKPLSLKKNRPTQFDFTRRDSLGVRLRDFSVMLEQTIESIKRYKKLDL